MLQYINMADKIIKDHKQIGQELELFFTDDIAPGGSFWLPKGMVIFKELEKYIRKLTENAGYLETSTPIMVKSQLFKQSGHWIKFGAHNMYNLSLWEDDEISSIKEAVNKYRKEICKLIDEASPRSFEYKIPVIFPNKTKEEIVEVIIIVTDFTNGDFMWNLPVNYSLKPMNCPESTIIYRHRSRSYKELPLRLSEIGRLHRREKSGEVNGLLRVRQITMDDAHIYIRESQILEEVSNILDMMISFYKNFGFEYEFRFATRPDLRAGSDQIWDKAEKDLENVLKKKNIKASDKKGDGAFYGPKIDLHIKDSIDREWQLATVQLDFHMPQAFDLKYINENGTFEKPVMIHRAIFGSFERFIAILTEHFQGAFPLWLSPIQAAILPISEKQLDYARKVSEVLKNESIRVDLDKDNKTIGAKIRESTLQKIPYMVIIGDKEMAESKDSALFGTVRTREGKDLGLMNLFDFIKILKEQIEKRVISTK